MKTIAQFMMCMILIAASMMSHASWAASDDALTPGQANAVDARIDQFIKNNPKAIVDALIAYREQAMQKRQQQVQAKIKANEKVVFSAKTKAILGNPRGDVTLVEFIDYQCKHCRDMGKVLDQLAARNANLKIVVRELPIFGGASLYAAKAALAAGNQNQFVTMHEALIAEKLPLSKPGIEAIARRLKLNLKTFKSDIKSNAIGQEIKSNFELAQQLHIMATPTFVIGKEGADQVFFVPGALGLYQLDSMVKKVK